MIHIALTRFDPSEALTSFAAGNHTVGGVGVFIGRVRDNVSGPKLRSLTLEHYPGMTERELENIESEARYRWNLIDTLIIHRVGRMVPGDCIVLVATAASHRAEALEACAFLIDWLKTKAPFWKLEETDDGSHWVDAKASDDAAAARWS